MSDDIYKRLQWAPCAGDPFWLELDAHTLRLLCQAARIDARALAPLLRKSRSLARKLLSGEASVTDGMRERIGNIWSIWPLQQLPPSPGAPPLCQFTPRSLELLRVGHGWSQAHLGEVSDTSMDYVKSLELGRRTHPRHEYLQALGQALGVRLFLA